MYKKEYRPDKEYKNTNIPGFNQDRLNPLSLRINSSNSSGGLYAAMSASSNMTIPDNTDTTITNLLTKSGDTTMTATNNQITITQDGIYLLSAYCYIGWSTGIGQLRIMKNGTSLVPYYVSTMTASGTTPYINIIEPLSSGDVLTLLLFQNSGGSRTLTNSRLSVLKI